MDVKLGAPSVLAVECKWYDFVLQPGQLVVWMMRTCVERNIITNMKIYRKNEVSFSASKLQVHGLVDNLREIRRVVTHVRESLLG